MELKDYTRAIAGRWVWAVATGAAGMILAVTIGVLTPAAYQASVAVYVGASLIEEQEDPSSAGEVQQSVLPSVTELARSERVLAAVAGRLGLPDSPETLAAGLDVVAERDSNVVDITATRPTPAEATAVARAVGAEVRSQAVRLYPGTKGPLLSVTAVQLAAEPATTGRSVPFLAVLGALAGAGVAGVAVGLRELGRPRVRGRRDVYRLTGVPPLALLPADAPAPRRRSGRAAAGASSPPRSEALIGLRCSLPQPPGGAARRVALLGAATATAALGRELAAPGLDVVTVDDPRRLAAASRLDGVIVVADGRGTTCRELQAALAAVRSSGVTLDGVVVDGLLPSGARWRDRVRAGVRGNATWWLDSREEMRGHRGPDVGRSPATRLTAVLAVAAAGFTHPLPMTLTSGLLAAVALLPVWLPVLRRYRGAVLLLALAGVALVSGALLAWSQSDDHGFALHEAGVRASLVLAAVGGVGLLLWARSVLSVSAIGTVFGIGMLAAKLPEMAGTDNIWKFGLSYPLMVIGLSVSIRWAKPWLTVTVLAVLGLANVTNDSRSAFAFCALAAVLVLWQSRSDSDRDSVRGHGRARRWLAVPLLAGLGAGGYWLLTKLILAGAFGAEIQQRSATQIAQSGSLLLGGRPEWTVTWALMQRHPLGFGLGIVPTGEDVQVAKAGIAVAHIPTADDYVLHYLLNGGVELHSIVADLWAGLGPAGLLLGLVMGGLVVVGMIDQLGRKQASGLVCLLVPMALWGLPFGPLVSNVDTLILAVGLLLLTRRPSPQPSGVPVEVAAAEAVAAVRPPRTLVATG